MKNKYILSLLTLLIIVILFILNFKFEIFTFPNKNIDYSNSLQKYLDEFNPNDPEALLYRIWQLENEGDFKKSKEYALKLIEVNPAALSYHTLANQYTFLGEHNEALKWRKKAVEKAKEREKDGFYYYLSNTQLLFDFDAALNSAKIEKKFNSEIGDDSHVPLQEYMEQLQKYRDNISKDPVSAIKELVSDYNIAFYQIKVEFINKHFNNKIITAEEKKELLELIRKDSNIN